MLLRALTHLFRIADLANVAPMDDAVITGPVINVAPDLPLEAAGAAESGEATVATEVEALLIAKEIRLTERLRMQ